MSKYEHLWKWIRDNGTDSFKLTYAEIEEITGVPIDHSPTKVFGDSGMCGCDFCGSSGRALYQDRSGHKMTGY